MLEVATLLTGILHRKRERQSGKEVVLLRLPPLETGRAPLNAPSLSTSRTTQLLFLILF